MSAWVPKYPDWNTYESAKHIAGFTYNKMGEGVQSAARWTEYVAAKPEVQKAAIVGVGAAAAIATVAVALPAVGFAAGGVKAGSIAASVQSVIGNVAAGSLFAKLTSAGAAGIAFSTKVLTGAGGGWLFSKL